MLKKIIKLNTDIFPKTKGAYMVGGSIRDILLGITPADYDIVVEKNPLKYAKKVAANTKGHMVNIGKPEQMIIRVVSENNSIDISQVNGSSIEEDLKNRDFTINSMAYSLYSGKIIDCMRSLRDLSEKKIRMVSNEVFKKDPIRLLRAFRICAVYNFDIEPDTLEAIKNNAKLIQNTAGERIRFEFLKILCTKKSHYYLCKMADTGLLFALFPELGPLMGCFQNDYHKYDVYEHTMNAYYHLESSINNESNNIHKIYELGIDKKNLHLLKCAILLHDIGKPERKTVNSLGKVHFFSHDQKSGEMAKKICGRLKFSNNEIHFIEFIIKNHLKPLFLFEAYEKNKLTHKEITRFFINCGNHTPYILLHSIADFMGKSERKGKAFSQFVTGTITDAYIKYSQKKSKPAFITGRDLISKFGLSPSPLFKTILNSVEEAALTGEIRDKKTAFEFVKKILKKE